MEKTNWADNYQFYGLLICTILGGFLFAEPGTPFAALTAAVFLFWAVGVFRFASKRQKELRILQIKLTCQVGKELDDTKARIEEIMSKPFWAIL
jgi:hypothetical protein